MKLTCESVLRGGESSFVFQGHVPARSGMRPRALLEFALEVFGEKGYRHAAVDDIVSRAGRSKGTGYFHFPNREAIFRALVRELASYLVQRVERE